jgi:hypothetical protein
MNMLDEALKYRSWGLSIIPQKNKIPLVPWTDYQRRHPTEDEIKKWWVANPDAGIAAVVGSISHLVVIDCDSKEAIEYLESQIPDSILVPTAQTPRGGRHYYFFSDEVYKKCTGIREKIDIQAEGSMIVMPPSRGPNGTPYQWILLPKSFDDFPNIEVLKSEDENSLYRTLKLYSENSFIGSLYRGNTTDVVNFPTNDFIGYKILQEGTRDNDLFKIGMALADGRLPYWMIEQVIERLALSANPPFPEKETKAKINSVLSRVRTKERNLAEEVREWCLLQEGYYSTTTIQHELQITTKRDIKNLTVILVRLQAEKIIEKYGEQRGWYRTIDKHNDHEMEFIEGEVKEFDVVLPFGLNKICSLYPKNIIIVAGSKGSGKTALLMNIALMNQDKHEVMYFNSEMGTEEWSRRLKNMGVQSKEDIGFKAYGIHKNFHDMMDESKKIYIIDYLEIHDNFYEIGKHIRKIHEAIKDGICFIGVQKKKGAMLARGAEFSMEKSRLYLNFEYLEGERCTKLTIVDAKSPKVPASLNGWSKRIKIVNGAKMEALDLEWKV